MLSRETSERLIKLMCLVQSLANNGYQASINCLRLVSFVIKTHPSYDGIRELKEEIRAVATRVYKEATANSEFITGFKQSLKNADRHSKRVLLQDEGESSLDKTWKRSHSLLKEFEVLIDKVTVALVHPTSKLGKQGEASISSSKKCTPKK